MADSSIISSLGGVPFERLGGVSVSADGVTTVKVFSPAQAATQEAALAEAERVQSGVAVEEERVSSLGLSAALETDRSLWRRQVERYASAPASATPAAPPAKPAEAAPAKVAVPIDPAASEPGHATELALNLVDAETAMRGLTAKLEDTLGRGPAQKLAEEVRASPAMYAADPRRLVKALASSAAALVLAKHAYAHSVESAQPMASRLGEAEKRSMFAEHRLEQTRKELEQAQKLLRGDVVGTNQKLQEELVQLKTALRAATRQLSGASERMDRLDPLQRKLQALEQRMGASDDALLILKRQAELAPAAAGMAPGGGAAAKAAAAAPARAGGAGDVALGQTQIEVREMDFAVRAVKDKMEEQSECIDLLRRECASQLTRIAELETLVHVRARDELVSQSKRIASLEARLKKPSKW